MVEIPEHLLKRSKERRAAMGLGGGDEAPTESGSGDAPAAAAPAAPAPAPQKAPPPEPKAPEPPRPDPLYIQAAKKRPRLPWWSMPVFAALPLWGWAFVGTLTPVEAESDVMTEGEELYAGNCAGCHGATGDGSGATPGLADVEDTFADFRDHMMWVRTGSEEWPEDTYGPEDTEITGGMPAFGTLSDEELAQVVLYERTAFGEGEEIDPEGADEIDGLTNAEGEPLTLQDMFHVAEGEMTFADLGLGEVSTEVGFTEDELE